MKRDHLIGVWLSKPVFDHVDFQATQAGVSRPEAIRKILLVEYINTQAAKTGLTAQQYISQLIQDGHLDQKITEELINNKEMSNGEQH